MIPQEEEKKPKKRKHRREAEPETPEWIDFSLKPEKQTPRELEESEMQTVELKPLRETEEDSVPKSQAEKELERPTSVEKIPKGITETDQKPKMPKKKKTRKRDTPDESPLAEEAEVLSPEEQVCCHFHDLALWLSFFTFNSVHRFQPHIPALLFLHAVVC